MLGVAFWGIFWTFAGVLLNSLTTIKQSYDYTTSKQLPFKNEKKMGRQGTEKCRKSCKPVPRLQMMLDALL